MFDPESVLFGQNGIDRAAHLRETAIDLLQGPEARTAVFWRGKALFHDPDAAQPPRLLWLRTDHPILAESSTPPIFLGLKDGAARFAHDISAWTDPQADTETMAQFIDDSANRHPALGADEVFLDLRANMGRLTPLDAGEAAAAKGIFSWHETHGFCARCGAASEVSHAGWQRTCPACGGHHFPRTDPVVIMLITHGDRLLLGRSPGWPEGMVSLLAGFMEPGETIEAAVRREVQEEAGIKVGRVSYLTSQPWPFPASLMIGCRGEALDDRITLDPVELEDAFWMTREEILAARQSDAPVIRTARAGAVAHFIIEHWLAGRIA